MTLRKLDKSEWHSYCDRRSKDLVGSRSRTATVSLAVNHEVITQWVPLFGVAYEPKKDLFEIVLQDLEHWVHHPQTFYVDEGPKGVAGLRDHRCSGSAAHSIAIPVDQIYRDGQGIVELDWADLLISGSASALNHPPVLGDRSE